MDRVSALIGKAGLIVGISSGAVAYPEVAGKRIAAFAAGAGERCPSTALFGGVA